MAVGSVFLWIGIPVGWVWIASRTVKSSQPSLGPYVLVLLATPVSMWIWGKFLFRLNAVYSRMTRPTRYAHSCRGTAACAASGWCRGRRPCSTS
jgi:hypothetical protein